MAKKDEERLKKRLAAKRKKIIITIVSLVVVIGAVIGIIAYVNYKNKPRVVVHKYKGLELSRFDTTVTEEDYKTFYESMLSNTPNYVHDETKDDLLVAKDDYISMNFVGKHNGEVFDGGSADDVVIAVGGGTMVEGFEETLIGRKVGETYTTVIKFPDNYVHDLELSGEDVEFTITVNYICKQSNEIDDAYINRNTSWSSIDDFEKSYLDNYLLSSKESYGESFLETQAINQLIENSDFYNIEDEVEDYYNRLMDKYTEQAKSYGYDLETYVKASYDGTMEEFKSMIHDKCETATKQNFILDVVIEKENLKVTDEIYAKYIDTVIDENNAGNEEGLKESYSEKKINHMILLLYALDTVYSYANITGP